MQFFLKIWNKIKNPHGIWLALFYVFFVLVTAGTLVLVILVQKQTIGHYLLYVLSALALTYFVYTMVIFGPKMKSFTINLLQKNKFTKSLVKDYGYRTIVFGVCTFIINIAYISLLATVAFISKTSWYFAITIYYIVLVIMKGNVFLSKRKYNTPVKEPIAFSVVMVLIYKTNKYFEYAGLFIYVAAAFTFYKLTLAIYNIFKARKHDDLYVENIRDINLASALISIIILQVAMFQAFSPNHNSGFANALTGAGVSTIIFTLGIIMILKANKKLKQINLTNVKENKN